MAASGAHRVVRLLAIAAWFGPIVRSQAPGDTGGQSCEQVADQSGQVGLLYSQNYRTLLAGQNSAAGWTQTSADAWMESGNLCARRLISCDVNSASSNWVVTQYILRSLNVSYPLKITVEISANTLEACLDTPTCASGSLGLYYYPNNGPVSSNEQLNTANYVLIGSTILQTSQATYSFSFGLDVMYDRFYIAIVDQSYCIELRELSVFYSICSGESVENVVYPMIPVGSAGILAEASCSNNFAPSPGSSLNITCNTDGSFSSTPNCSICREGHFVLNGICRPCASGTYLNPITSSCDSCPANSVSVQQATAVCTCSNGYYRASTDPPSQACGVGPGPASSLTLVLATSDEVSFSWTGTEMTGGRSDIFYRIGYRTPEQDAFTFYDPTSRIIDTNATIPNMFPSSSFIVVVVTENGVSYENPEIFPVSARTSNEVIVPAANENTSPTSPGDNTSSTSPDGNTSPTSPGDSTSSTSPDDNTSFISPNDDANSTSPSKGFVTTVSLYLSAAGTLLSLAFILS